MLPPKKAASGDPVSHLVGHKPRQDHDTRGLDLGAVDLVLAPLWLSDLKEWLQSDRF